MSVSLSTTATDKSTLVVTASFTDENGDAVIPTAAAWSLYNRERAIVNSRDEVTISGLAASVDIVLSGDDLDASANGRTRYLLVEATYNSDAGTGLPVRQEAEFEITDLVGV